MTSTGRQQEQTARSTSIQIIDPEASSGRPCAPGIIADGDLLFVSGQIPIRDGRIVRGPIEAQVETVLENIEAGLYARLVACGGP